MSESEVQETPEPEVQIGIEVEVDPKFYGVGTAYPTEESYMTAVAGPDAPSLEGMKGTEEEALAVLDALGAWWGRHCIQFGPDHEDFPNALMVIHMGAEALVMQGPAPVEENAEAQYCCAPIGDAEVFEDGEPCFLDSCFLPLDHDGDCKGIDEV